MDISLGRGDWWGQPPYGNVTLENNVFGHSVNGSGWHYYGLRVVRRQVRERPRGQQHVRERGAHGGQHIGSGPVLGRVGEQHRRRLVVPARRDLPQQRRQEVRRLRPRRLAVELVRAARLPVRCARCRSAGSTPPRVDFHAAAGLAGRQRRQRRSTRRRTDKRRLPARRAAGRRRLRVRRRRRRRRSAAPRPGRRRWSCARCALRPRTICRRARRGCPRVAPSCGVRARRARAQVPMRVQRAAQGHAEARARARSCAGQAPQGACGSAPRALRARPLPRARRGDRRRRARARRRSGSRCACAELRTPGRRAAA